MLKRAGALAISLVIANLGYAQDVEGQAKTMMEILPAGADCEWREVRNLHCTLPGPRKDVQLELDSSNSEAAGAGSVSHGRAVIRGFGRRDTVEEQEYLQFARGIFIRYLSKMGFSQTESDGCLDKAMEGGRGVGVGRVDTTKYTLYCVFWDDYVDWRVVINQ